MKQTKLNLVLGLIFSVSLLFGFAASADSCQMSCLVDADCGTGGYCDSLKCLPKPFYCANERWSVSQIGKVQDCGAFTCDDSTGACRRSATLAVHCTNGYVDNGQGSCIKSISCNPQRDPECERLLEQWSQVRTDYEARTPAPTPNILSCRSCSAQNQCSAQEMCYQQTCKLQQPVCEQDQQGNWLSRLTDGNVVSCGDFNCNQSSGSCIDLCFIDSECSSGKKCLNQKCQ